MSWHGMLAMPTAGDFVSGTVTLRNTLFRKPQSQKERQTFSVTNAPLPLAPSPSPRYNPLWALCVATALSPISNPVMGLGHFCVDRAGVFTATAGVAWRCGGTPRHQTSPLQVVGASKTPQMTHTSPFTPASLSCNIAGCIHGQQACIPGIPGAVIFAGKGL